MILKAYSHINKIFILFLLFFSIIFNQHYGTLGVFPIDTFLHFDSGYRILNGDNPFKDYWTVAAPLVDYIQAIFFYFFGVSWKTYVFHASIINAILTLVTYFVLRNFKLNIYYSFFYSLLFSILAYPSSGTPFIDHHAAFFSLLGIYSFLLAINNQKKIYWFFLPIFLGLAFFSKQVPSSYVILSISFLILLYAYKNKKYDCIKYSLIGTSLFVILVLTFGKLQGIKLSSFIDQYIYYPQSIGGERFQNFNFTFRGVVGHFKFIYISIIPLFYINMKNVFLNKNYMNHNNFYYFLCLFLLTISFILHQLLTKNQTFIFFLVPILAAFSHISLINFKIKIKNILYLIIIFFCIFVTFKYHLRFNEKRKFHELQNTNLEISINAKIIDEKLSGLNWITPQFKNYPINEIELINQIKVFLKNDLRKKMVITNYSFFSSILDQKTFSPSRVYAGDGTTNPIKGSNYISEYKKLMISLIKKNKISVIYIIGPLDSSNIYDYIGKQCFEEKNVLESLKSYEIRNCDEI